MSEHWATHALCRACWDFLSPGREPARMRAADMEKCCKCGRPTWAGIYIRAENSTMPNCTMSAGHTL